MVNMFARADNCIDVLEMSGYGPGGRVLRGATCAMLKVLGVYVPTDGCGPTGVVWLVLVSMDAPKAALMLAGKAYDNIEGAVWMTVTSTQVTGTEDHTLESRSSS